MSGISTDMISLNVSVIHGTINGFSRKVLWLKVLCSNNSPSVIGSIYFDCVKEMDGCPIKLICDLGTKNVLVAAMQTFFDNILMVISTYPHQEIKELRVGGHFLPRLGETGGDIFFFT